MYPSSLLPRSFFDREVVLVARDLLGMRLVNNVGNTRISGLINETEAYRGEEDQACHARVGKTTRTAVMYGPPGHAYIYFTYGMHWLLNCVTGTEGFPAAVLIRSVIPMEGLDFIAANRANRPPKSWCDGPGKLCQAFGINGNLNDVDLTRKEGGLWLEEGKPVSGNQVISGPRVGLGSTPEPWLSMPWRFRLRM